MSFFSRRSSLWFCCMATLLLVNACTPATPTASSARGFAYIWYVALSGDNDNSCDAAASPCRNLEGALAKARATNTRVTADYPGETVAFFHTVNVAAGTYNETGRHAGAPFAYGNINVTVVGEGQTATIFDADNMYGGIFISGDVQVVLRNLAIQNVNGTAPDSCVNIRGAAEVTIEDATLRHCVRSGIAHSSSGPLTLTRVTSTENIVDAGGNGLGVSSSGELSIQGGSFSSNQGIGIGSSGTLEASGVLVEANAREGVAISGTADLDEVNIVGNGTDGSFRAGLSLFEGADVTVRNSHIDNNQHGIWQHAGNLRLIESTVNGNPRTAIILDAGEMRLTESIVEGNGAFYAGTSLPGAMSIESGARAIFRESRVLGNLNGGIANYGELFFIDSELSRQSGAGVPLFNTAGATAIIERSLIADNSGGGTVADGGVAVENRGAMNMINTTISGNESVGLTNSGSLNLAFSTIAFNGKYGFLSSESSTASPWLINALVAGNGTDCYVPGSPTAAGAYTLVATNIDTDGSCGFPETYTLADLHLEALADNGGPTLTHALLSGSPAIDSSSGSCPPNDQRSLARPFGAACDSGAYEAGSTILRISDETTDFDPEDFATATPGLTGSLIVIPDKNYNCRYGNSSAFDIADTLLQGQEYLPVGIGPDSLWLQFEGPTFGQLCWSLANGFTLYLDGNEITLNQLPASILKIVNYPPLPPTATPTPDPDEGDNFTPTPIPSATATCTPQQIQNQQCP